MTGRAWLPVAEGSPFPLGSLPLGVGRTEGAAWRAWVAIGDQALDLAAVQAAGLLDMVDPAHVRAEHLDGLLALGNDHVRSVRDRVRSLLTDRAVADRLADALAPLGAVEMRVPVSAGDYVDFYSSLHHATNLGRLFRPDGEPLLPNWRHLPIGYHGRSGTLVADGAEIPRPNGVRLIDGEPEFGPTGALDIELEVGFVVGAPSARGCPIPAVDAEHHIAGVCLVNDWSARDIQAFEYQPLGPFLGKSFATSVSPWIVPLDALEPFRVEPPVQDPPVSEHLRTTGSTGFADMYWTPAQQLAHLTANGASVRAGDLFASGTVSGPDPGTEGSFIELTWRGERPITLPDGTTRTFLLDGDTVVVRGWAGDDPATRIGLGEVRGTIVPTTRR
ncbi:MAG TPA: fumarylacetoacetate hydrolase family protein [Ilumatobacteraceae bacterium]